MMILMASPLTVSSSRDDEIDGITFNCVQLEMMILASPLTVSNSRDDEIDGITFNCV